MGEHTVEVSKPGYTTLTQTVTINEGQTANLNVEFEEVHSDDDGMSDIEESSYSDSYGNTLSSDPFNTDTDGDGLSDGYEAGDIVIDSNDNTYRKIRSNPLKVDSDNDGLNDYIELKESFSKALIPDTDNDNLKDGLEWDIGTDLWSPDSDDDGVDDFYEYYDLDPFTSPTDYEERKNPAGILQELQAGLNAQSSPSGEDRNPYHLFGETVGLGGVNLGIKMLIVDTYHALEKFNEDRPYKNELDTFEDFLEMASMLPQCGGPEAKSATIVLKEAIEESPKYYDDIVNLAKKIMKDPADAEKAIAEIDDAIKVPSTEIIKNKGFANWKVSEEWLAQTYSGKSQEPLTVTIGGEQLKRIIDQLAKDSITGELVAHEIKTGRVYASKEIKIQIDKDIALIKEGQVDKVMWHFAKSGQTGKSGYSKPLGKYIEEQCEKKEIELGEQFELVIM